MRSDDLEATRPEAVVREQVAAFNAHDLDRFLATYSANASVFGVAPTLVEGADALRDLYSGRLDDERLHCRLTSLTVLDDRWVVALEHITSAAGEVEAVATFEVVNGLIQRVAILRKATARV